MGTKLDGRVVAVTGGARGIGRAIAESLRARGALVGIGDLDADGADATAKTIGGDTVGMGLDVRDRASFTAFLDAVEEAHGPLDVLVNNAGVMFVGPLDHEDDGDTHLMLDVNVGGTLLGMKLAVARMRPRGRGHVVNIASMAGKQAFAGGVTYTASKHAIVGASDALRAELRGTGLRVSTIMPGQVDTELAKGQPEAKVGWVTPAEVGEAVVHVVETGKDEATVPWYLNTLVRALSPLPPAGQQTMLKLFGGEGALRDIDPSVRADYERRMRETR